MARLFRLGISTLNDDKIEIKYELTSAYPTFLHNTNYVPSEEKIYT
jgi:hypothetical protein